MADARKDKRTLLSLKIRYKSATLEDFIERYSADISRGGVFIKSKKPLPVGTLLKFEFMLHDQSTLIHGVGRVVWRRDASESDSHNPPGMGIKFIKMDPDSRSVVQQIAEDRSEPGVFEHGKEGMQPPSLVPPEGSRQEEADRTKVRHVSEFLASALEEGDAGDSVRREANAGAERARSASDRLGHRSPARGAFSGASDGRGAGPESDAPSRGAMSAFGGGSGLASTANMRRSSAAPAMEELDAEEDFLDDETTKIHDTYESEYPHAARTVVSHDAASQFAAEKRATPVVPKGETDSRVSDLFGPDSFGPAVDSIDPKLLDSEPAEGPGDVPEAPGIPAEAFKLQQPTEPVWTMRPAEPEPETRGWMAMLLLGLLVVAAGIAAWQLGLADGLIAALAGPDATTATPAAPPRLPAEKPSQPIAEAPAPAPDAPEAQAEAAAAVEATDTPAADGTLVKFEVVSKPSGAFVSVNGKGVGRTPLELEYEVGTKLSIFSKARGFLPRRTKVTVEANQPKVELSLPTLPFVIEVVSNPLGANVSSVGGGATTTPGSLKFKSMGSPRRVVIAKDGYKTVTKTVTRANFIEEPRRMVTTLSVALQPDGNKPSPAPSEPKPEPEAPAEPTAKAEAPAEAPSAEAPAAPAPTAPEPSQPSAPSEPSAADAP